MVGIKMIQKKKKTKKFIIYSAALHLMVKNLSQFKIWVCNKIKFINSNPNTSD